jgi:hypothetical protein
VLIPNKELVYSDYILNNKNLKNWEFFKKLTLTESIISDELKRSFTENNIEFCDVLESFNSATGKQDIYYSNWDIHPNKYGYKIIANEIINYINN